MAGTTPARATGAAAAVKIDGIDLHTFGMIVDQVDNPVPSLKRASIGVAGMDGEYDFSERLQPRSISISGNFIADNLAQLMANVDECRKFLRAREGGASFQVIFQNQTDRYWTCRYDGQFSFNPNGKWLTGKSANFSFNLRCVYPYAEKTSVTTEDVFLSDFDRKIITYAGTHPAPITITYRGRVYKNILEEVGGDTSQSYALWTLSNATGSDVGSIMYGMNSPRFTRSSAAPFYAQIDVSAKMGVSKYYVVCGWIDQQSGASLKLILPGAAADLTTNPAGVYARYFAWMKVQPSDMASSSQRIYRWSDTGASNVYDTVSGCYIYEITAAEYADANYYPPPFMSDPAGDDFVPPKNPSLWLFAGRNEFPLKNGEAITNWTGGHVDIVSDPLGGRDKCYLVSCTGGSIGVASLPMYVRPGTTSLYMFQYDFFLEECDAGGFLQVGFHVKPEYSAGYLREYTNHSAVGTAWGTHQARIANWAGCCVASVRFGNSGAARLYIKNIQVVPDLTGADPYPAYEGPNKQQFLLTRTIDGAGDSVHADFDRMNFRALDISTGASENIADDVQSDRLALVPGMNILHLMDARRDSASYWGVAMDPHLQSAGAIQCRTSYRERYL